MTYTPTVYDWRSSIIPSGQVFFAGGQFVAGALTLGGAQSQTSEPGGRSSLRLSFNALHLEANQDASWTMSRLLDGSIMRIPIIVGPQLVPATSFGAVAGSSSKPWANSEPWANDENWDFDPLSLVTSAASKGDTSFSADLSDFGEVLKIGHIIGFRHEGYHVCHMVMDVEYDESTIATAQISPPLRRDIAVGDFVLFRPKMTVTARNPEKFVSLFDLAGMVKPGSLEFAEALL